MPHDGKPVPAAGPRLVRPESEKHTGQAPPEDIDGGQDPTCTTRGDRGGTG